MQAKTIVESLKELLAEKEKLNKAKAEVEKIRQAEEEAKQREKASQFPAKEYDYLVSLPEDIKELTFSDAEAHRVVFTPMIQDIAGHIGVEDAFDLIDRSEPNWKVAVDERIRAFIENLKDHTSMRRDEEPEMVKGSGEDDEEI